MFEFYFTTNQSVIKTEKEAEKSKKCIFCGQNMQKKVINMIKIIMMALNLKSFGFS